VNCLYFGSNAAASSAVRNSTALTATGTRGRAAMKATTKRASASCSLLAEMNSIKSVAVFTDVSPKSFSPATAVFNSLACASVPSLRTST
jgi:hypothetical protein